MKLLDLTNQHASHLLERSVVVSLFGVLLARAVHWKFPTTHFTLVAAGLLQNVGAKGIDRDTLLKPRQQWTSKEMKYYETHRTRGLQMLMHLETIPAEAVQVIGEYAQFDASTNSMLTPKKGTLAPMAKLFTVANEFCERSIKTPAYKGMPANAAIEQMDLECGKLLEPEFFSALKGLFAGA